MSKPSLVAGSQDPQGIPNEPLWANMLKRARSLNRPILHDTTLGVDVDLTQLFTDILYMRQVLW